MDNCLTAKKFKKICDKFLTEPHNIEQEEKRFVRELNITQRALFIDRGMSLLLKKEGL